MEDNIQVTVVNPAGTEVIPALHLGTNDFVGKVRMEIENVLNINKSEHECKLLYGSAELRDDCSIGEACIPDKALITATVMESSKVVVYLEEEYGYRWWLWHSGMSAYALRKYWTELLSVSPFFLDPRKLPGVMAPVFASRNSKDDENCLRSFLPETLSWKESENLELCPDPASHAIGTEIHYTSKDSAWWSGHLHEDDDSYLMDSEGNKILHKHYTSKESAW